MKTKTKTKKSDNGTKLAAFKNKKMRKGPKHMWGAGAKKRR